MGSSYSRINKGIVKVPIETQYHEIEALLLTYLQEAWNDTAIAKKAGAFRAFDTLPGAERWPAFNLHNIDPALINLITRGFPQHKGVEFFLCLLKHALIIPSLFVESQAYGPYVAIVQFPSIQKLAHKIGWGYDTTHKYIVIFRALNLLQKQRFNDTMELIIPFQRYIPPADLQALDTLITRSRPKVRQYARCVKERCLLAGLLNSNTGEEATPKQTNGQAVDVDATMQRVHQQLCRFFFESRVSYELAGHMIPKIKKYIVGLIYALAEQTETYVTNEQSYANIKPDLSLVMQMVSASPTEVAAMPAQVSIQHREYQQTHKNPYTTAKSRYACPEHISTQISQLMPFNQRDIPNKDQKNQQPVSENNNNFAPISQNRPESQNRGFKDPSSVSSSITSYQGQNQPLQGQIEALSTTEHIDKIKNHQTEDIPLGNIPDTERKIQSSTGPVTDQFEDQVTTHPIYPNKPVTDMFDNSAMGSIPDTERKIQYPDKQTTSQLEDNSIPKREKINKQQKWQKFQNREVVTTGQEKKPTIVPRQITYLSQDPNVYTLYVTSIEKLLKHFRDDVTLRDKRELERFLATIFDQDNVEKATRWYGEIVRTTPENILLSVFVQMMIYLHAKGYERIERPGAMFIQRCIRLTKDREKYDDRYRRYELAGAMPYEDITRILDKLRGMSFDAIEETFLGIAWDYWEAANKEATEAEYKQISLS